MGRRGGAAEAWKNEYKSDWGQESHHGELICPTLQGLPGQSGARGKRAREVEGPASTEAVWHVGEGGWLGWQAEAVLEVGCSHTMKSLECQNIDNSLHLMVLTIYKSL
jgi:hypothetical protein